MILSYEDIIEHIKSGKIGIDPFEIDHVQPSSLDVTLGAEFKIFKHQTHALIDVKEKNIDYTETIVVPDGEKFIIHPGDFVLGTSVEKITMPNNMVARLEGRSSLGRLGIIIHATAGYIDPGFSGYVTLEISNVGKIPVALYPGMRIAQMSFMKMSSETKNPYGTRNNKYNDQEGPTESMIYKDFQIDKNFQKDKKE